VEGKKFLVVSPGYLKEKGITLKEEKIKEIEEQGKQSCSCSRATSYWKLSRLLILFGKSPGKQSQNSKA
jgi:hypothetical protein